MKRLANCFFKLFMLIIVSTLMVQRGFFEHNLNSLNLNLFKSTPKLINYNVKPTLVTFAHAQEYSTYEERIYISESYFIQPQNQQHEHKQQQLQQHQQPQYHHQLHHHHQVHHDHPQQHQQRQYHHHQQPQQQQPQHELYQQQHHHHHQQQQQQQQQHEPQQQDPPNQHLIDHEYHKLVYELHHHEQHLIHHQQQPLQQHHQHVVADHLAPHQTQKHQQFIYARHISDEHDYEAAHQYYYSSRSIIPAQDSPTCDPIDDSTILILPNEIEQPSCRAASRLRNADDPATAAAHATDSLMAHGPARNSNVESYPLAPQHYHYESSLIAAIRHYWREVGGLCIASAIFLNWLFVVVKRKIIGTRARLSSDRSETMNELTNEQQQQQHRLQQQQQQQQHTTVAPVSSKSLSKDTNTNSAHDSAFEENVSPMSLDDVELSSHTQSSTSLKEKSTASLQNHRRKRSTSPVLRQRSSTLKADTVCCPSSGHASLSQSASLSTTITNTSEYISRYSSDFDSIQRLGRGGFGIVFEAKNKIDDCHYAVKRICLPLEKEARERVMREVRALAKLDHVGIVRYYNAWLETPPDDWLKQHDAQLGIVHSRDGMSFPSTDGIYDRGESELQRQTRRPQTKNIGESGDNSSEWLGTNNTNKNSLRHRRTNGYISRSKFLRNNSSSPSLDIVFEGSGSIRLEADNNTKETDSNKGALKSKNDKKLNKNNGDLNNSDSEDSDFIQFESKGNDDRCNALNDLEDENDSSDGEASISANHLTEPFSSSSSDDSKSDKGSKDGVNGAKKEVPNEEDNGKHLMAATTMAEARRRALSYQKDMRQLQNGENNVSSNLHFEKVYLYIQMQLCRKDTLKDWLRTNCENRDKTTIFDLFYQIVDAVEYVHSQDLIHRDLKPSNIFFSLDGTLKIGDFGLCRAKTNAGVGSSLDLQEYVAESEVERGFDAVHTEQVGTQLYMSPEQLNGLSYNQKVDVFAMGLILLELLIPFKTQMQRVNVLFKARNNLYSEEFQKNHTKEYELVKSLLSRSPQKRPTATDIKQHELLVNAQLSQPVIERIYHRRRTISSNSSTE